MKKYGDRQSVYDGLCKMTRGGLMKEDLMMSRGKIVSKKKSDLAKLNYSKYGFKKRQESEPEAEKKKRKYKRKPKNVTQGHNA